MTHGHYGSMKEKYYVLCISSYPPCLEQSEPGAICDERWMLCVSESARKLRKLLLRMMDVVLLFLGRISPESDNVLIRLRLLLHTGRHGFYTCYDCLYLCRKLSHTCIVLNLRFQQTLHTKHDFCVLLKRRLISRFACFQGIQSQTLVTFFCNCIVCWRKCRRQLISRFRFKLVNQSIPSPPIHFNNGVWSGDKPSFQLFEPFMCLCNLYLQHNFMFIAAIKNLMCKNLLCCTWVQRMILIINKLLVLKRKNKSRRQCLYIFRLNCRSSLIIGILYQQVKNMNAMWDRDYKKNHLSWQGEQNFIGGYSSPVFAFGLLEPHI